MPALSARKVDDFATKNATRSRLLRRVSFCVAVAAILVVGATIGGAEARERSVSADTSRPSLTSGGASGFSTVSPLPERSPLYQMAPPSVAEGRLGASVNAGPVSGYGPGGMGRVPGSLPNPPYH